MKPTISLFFPVAVVTAAACSSTTTTSTSGGGADASVEGGGSGSPGADGSSASDAGATGDDASASTADASTGSGKACGFNVDCPASERCECSEADGCFCHTGTRGSGKNGIDTCKDGNDCASSLCVEGPGGTYYCSDQCIDMSGCTGMLPLCQEIAGIGMICVRMP